MCNNSPDADDQVIIADTEDNLQKAAYNLNQIITEYGLLYQYRKQNRWHLTLQRGVTGTARMLHALTHSSISRQVREQM